MSIGLRGRGDLLPLPSMPVAVVPLRVQLQGAGRSWETRYDATGTLANGSGYLRLRGPSR